MKRDYPRETVLNSSISTTAAGLVCYVMAPKRRRNRSSEEENAGFSTLELQRRRQP